MRRPREVARWSAEWWRAQRIAELLEQQGQFIRGQQVEEHQDIGLF